MKTFALAIIILSLGTVAMRSFTHAELPKQDKSASIDLEFGDLNDGDLATLRSDVIAHGVKLVYHDSRLSAIDAQIIALESKASPVKVVAAIPVKATLQTKAVSNCPGGVCPTTTVAAVNHWTYPGEITSHLQTAHGKQTAGMSMEQQLSAHDAIHEAERRGLTRSVTRTNVQSVPARSVSNCPGGVCPTNAASVTRSSSFSMPRLFRRR